MQNATSVPASSARGEGALQRLKAAFEFRYFTLFTVMATYGLIILGGTVRVTDSGTACPDWPLCHGQVIPPADTKVWIEFSHRLAASIVGFLILGIAFIVWRRYRGNKVMLGAAITMVVLLGAQVLVGGVTVGTETAAAVVAIHLSIALALITCLIFIAVGVQGQLRANIAQIRGVASRMPVLTAATFAGLFTLIIVGAFVSQMEAGLAYPDWPLFDGKLTSSGSTNGDIHYAHRLLAAVVGVLMITLVVRVLRSEKNSIVLAGFAVVFTLFAAEVMVGASNVWLDLTTSVRIVHLALASATWAVLVFALAWSHMRSEEANS
ncbi:MAG: COX15/CtaA family protein [Chloroflexi bacterium]|nr:COX15/CtaA family protein [Chloroflexota bacterium]